jgi:hypothetical protein
MMNGVVKLRGVMMRLLKLTQLIGAQMVSILIMSRYFFKEHEHTIALLKVLM